MLALYTKTFSSHKKYSSILGNQDDDVNNDDVDDGHVNNDDGDVEQYHGYLPLHAADLLPPTSQSALTTLIIIIGYINW